MNCHPKTQGFDTECKTTVNQASNILQPKRTKMQKIRQVTKNYGKWKDARIRKEKQMQIILNRLTDEKK